MMIVSNTPPPSKYWSEKQKKLYNECLNDKNCILAYYLTDKNNFPLHSPIKNGWKVKSGLIQNVEPHPTRGIVPCTGYALHATRNIEPWVKINSKIWVVAMFGKTIKETDKICGIKRMIIGSYHPSELHEDIRFITYPNFTKNIKDKDFCKIRLERNLDENSEIRNISFENVSFNDVVFCNVPFKNCKFKNVIFNGECNFYSSGFLNCTFTNCSFNKFCYVDRDFEISGKIKELYWYSSTIPNDFRVNDNNCLVKLPKKGNKNV